jgi:hypothetical protein
MGDGLVSITIVRMVIGLQHMTPGTFHGTGFKFLVTSDTLLMEGIGSFGNIFIIAFKLVAIATRFDTFNFTHFHRMMTVSASDTIAVYRCMGLMIEKNFASGAFEHDPNRVVRDFGGKSSIAENTNNQ